MFFDNLPKYERLTLVEALDDYAVRDTFKAIEIFTEMRAQGEALLSKNDKELSAAGVDAEEFRAKEDEVKSLVETADHILKGAPYLLFECLNSEVDETVEEEIDDFLERYERTELMSTGNLSYEDIFPRSAVTIHVLSLYSTMALLDKAGASYCTLRTNEYTHLFIEFDIRKCSLERMRKKKTGTSEGTLLVPPEDKILPTLSVITKSDMAWYMENKTDEE